MHIRSIAWMILMSIPLTATAQPAPSAPPPGFGGGRSGGGMVDPAQFKFQITEAIKIKLAPTDVEWKTLRPLIEKVQEAQRNCRTGAGMSFSTGPQMKGMINGKPIDKATEKAVTGGMQASAGGGASVDTLPSLAMQDLRGAIDAKSSDEELVKRIAALHEARDKAKEDLATAQKNLRKACTPRQEAILITLNQLD